MAPSGASAFAKAPADQYVTPTRRSFSVGGSHHLPRWSGGGKGMYVSLYRLRNLRDRCADLPDLKTERQLVRTVSIALRARASARSFSGWPEWPATHFQATP